MKVKTEEREGLSRALVVEVEGSVVKTALEEVYRHLRENVEIQGFRKGTAPLWLIRAKYRDYIREQVGKKVADRTLRDAIRESKLSPVADVFLERVDLEERVPRVTYTVSFEVPPKVELKDIGSLEVEVPKIEFSEEFVERKIQELREEHAVWEPVDREVREGDLVTIEYEVVELEEGERVSGETSGIIGQRMFRKELEEALKGKKVGDVVELKNLPLYNPQGKEIGKANTRAKVKEVKEKVLPEIGDEFAKELGYENWDSARRDIERTVREEFERVKRSIVEQAVADKLVKEHEIEVPKTLLNRELSFLVGRRVNEMKRYGADPRYIDQRAIAEELLPRAIANIKLGYILDAYTKERGIEVTERDVEEHIEELAKETGSKKEDVREYFEKENLMEALRVEVLRKKALRDIIGRIKIREVERRDEETS